MHELYSTIDVNASLGSVGNAAPVAAPLASSGNTSNNAYKGAEINRLNRGWQPTERSGDQAIREDFQLLNSRMRDLLRNDPLMKKLKREMCKHTIGPTGIQTF